MEKDNETSLTTKEIESFEQLKDDLRSPGHLQGKVVQALYNKELLTKKRMTKSLILGIAASIVTLVCGFFIGQNIHFQTTTITHMNKYLLLLYENESFDGEDEASMIEEYTQWATDLSEQEKLEGAEKLADEGEWLGNQGTKNKESHVTGYFIIKAKNFQEALVVAKTHPHSSHGGGIEIRPIEKLE